MPRAAYFDGPGHLFSLMLVCSTARDGLKKRGRSRGRPHSASDRFGASLRDAGLSKCTLSDHVIAVTRCRPVWCAASAAGLVPACYRADLSGDLGAGAGVSASRHSLALLALEWQKPSCI
jgi:hypothetical protein